MIRIKSSLPSPIGYLFRMIERQVRPATSIEWHSHVPVNAGGVDSGLMTRRSEARVRTATAARAPHLRFETSRRAGGALLVVP